MDDFPTAHGLGVQDVDVLTFDLKLVAGDLEVHDDREALEQKLMFLRRAGVGPHVPAGVDADRSAADQQRIRGDGDRVDGVEDVGLGARADVLELQLVIAAEAAGLNLDPVVVDELDLREPLRLVPDLDLVAVEVKVDGGGGEDQRLALHIQAADIFGFDGGSAIRLEQDNAITDRADKMQAAISHGGRIPIQRAG